MTPPASPDPTAPETPVSGAVAVLHALHRVLCTEPGWDQPVTQERLAQLIDLTVHDLRAQP